MNTGLLIADGDLCVAGGSLAIGPVDAGIIERVIAANRGEFREHPLLGGEIRKMQHGIGSRIWCARAKSMCREAGVEVRRVTISGGNTVKVE